MLHLLDYSCLRWWYWRYVSFSEIGRTSHGNDCVSCSNFPKVSRTPCHNVLSWESLVTHTSAFLRRCLVCDLWPLVTGGRFRISDVKFLLLKLVGQVMGMTTSHGNDCASCSNFPEVLRTPCHNVLSWESLVMHQLSFVAVWFVISDRWLQEIDLNLQKFSWGNTVFRISRELTHLGIYAFRHFWLDRYRFLGFFRNYFLVYLRYYFLCYWPHRCFVGQKTAHSNEISSGREIAGSKMD